MAGKAVACAAWDVELHRRSDVAEKIARVEWRGWRERLQVKAAVKQAVGGEQNIDDYIAH